MAKTKDTTEMDVGQTGNASFSADNKMSLDDLTVIPTTDVVGLDEKAKALAFMEEPVSIVIHESTDPNAESMIYLGVNGEGPLRKDIPWVPRGQTLTVKRKYVDRLARSKKTTVKSVERVNPNTGEREIAYPRHTALAYPFSVVDDPNPRGATWLKQVLAEA